MRVSIKCACGRGRLKSNPTCDKCLAAVEMSQGDQYTSSNFDLRGLTLDERRLVFLWACGQDITEYFDCHYGPPALADDGLLDSIDAQQFFVVGFGFRFRIKDEDI